MKNLAIKSSLIFCLLIFGFGNLSAQTKCCASKKGATADAPACAGKTATADGAKTACCASKGSSVMAAVLDFMPSFASKKEATTSGCNPSSCRGAKTKFGEAKAITTLRMQLIDLKADMETYEKVKFPERTYSVHGIVGQTDEESLEIIAKEVSIIESKFVETFDLKLDAFEIPENKAKQVQYLAQRIGTFQEVL